MKTLASLVTVSCAFLLLVHSASGQQGGPQSVMRGEADVSRPFLTGKWEGVMTGVGALPDGSPSAVPPFNAARGQYGFRLDIRQTNLVMYFQAPDGSWIGLGEGQDLRTNENATTATASTQPDEGRSAKVITALNASNGGIEAIMLNIVRWSETTIAVHMSRVTGAGPSGGALPPSVNSMGILNRAEF